ncbi:MarC family protein [Vibrio sp. SS-MA-C1-2]|uniref:MarC family protein n=1 Tax=Vibrio sp. SS-MA-C1-2 TaxID=2908646 RepID=UPI001F202B10|nr:MarC family protein [Vibrio sp. SS-MA-C1-2]UJF16970.1 MarC family protein [Vibrio sp. SS-MA-C1-2]
MSDIISVAVTAFMGFFAVMNPIANTAVFVGMTGEMNHAQRRGVAFKALFTAFCIIAAFCLLGKGIFELFGITLPALRLAGGVLVFMVGYHMLQGSSSSMHSEDSSTESESETSASKVHQPTTDVAISPLAVPILAGPGTIATAMNYSASGGIIDIIVTISTFALLCFISFFCFMSGQKLINIIGESGVTIATRLMGLILTVIGMQMLIQGLHDGYQLFSSTPL